MAIEGRASAIEGGASLIEGRALAIERSESALETSALVIEGSELHNKTAASHREAAAFSIGAPLLLHLLGVRPVLNRHRLSQSNTDQLALAERELVAVRR